MIYQVDLLIYCFQASLPDSLPPPVCFSPPEIGINVSSIEIHQLYIRYKKGIIASFTLLFVVEGLSGRRCILGHQQVMKGGQFVSSLSLFPQCFYQVPNCCMVDSE